VRRPSRASSRPARRQGDQGLGRRRGHDEQGREVPADLQVRGCRTGAATESATEAPSFRNARGARCHPAARSACAHRARARARRTARPPLAIRAPRAAPDASRTLH
jgi:hypothetical protein